MSIKKTPRKASDLGIQIGHRIRQRRMYLGLTQEKMGELLGLTFQQFQKYENAKNRVTADRLWQIAQILEVPIGYFYEDDVSASLTTHPSTTSEIVSKLRIDNEPSELELKGYRDAMAQAVALFVNNTYKRYPCDAFLIDMRSDDVHDCITDAMGEAWDYMKTAQEKGHSEYVSELRQNIASYNSRVR